MKKGRNYKLIFFYTKTGLAYVKTLESISLIEIENYTKEQQIKAINRFELIQNEIILGALKKILLNPDINYVQPLNNMICYLLRFGKINKYEYAYLLYVNQTYNNEDEYGHIDDTIMKYREGNLEIDVNVCVRNDIKTRKRTNSQKRKEGISYLTSYGYFISLLCQAGLVKKVENYYYVIEKNRKKLEELGGINND